MRLETIAVHAGHAVDPTTGAVAPPIHLSTTFARREDLSLPADFLYARDPSAVERAMRPTTRLVWAETPSNPLLALVDIARVAEIAHAHGARCVVDNTWATPVGQHPLALGADLVMHSSTKYLGGHSDVM